MWRSTDKTLDTPRKTLYLVDASHVFYMTYSAFVSRHPDHTMDDVHRMFPGMIQRNLRRLCYPPGNVVMVLDCFRQENWRLGLEGVNEYKNYSKTRGNIDDSEAHLRMKAVRTFFYDEFLEAWCCAKRATRAVIRVDQAEADDIIGALVPELLSQHEDLSIVIISGDSDFVQLTDPRTKVRAYDGKDVVRREVVRYELPDDVERARLGAFIVAVKALCGDTSDGVPAICHENHEIFSALFADPRAAVTLARDKADTYDLNRTLVDFSRIPDKIRAEAFHTWNDVCALYPVGGWQRVRNRRP